MMMIQVQSRIRCITPPPPTTHTCFPNHPGFSWKVISLDKVTSYGKIPRNVLANPVSTIVLCTNSFVLVLSSFSSSFTTHCYFHPSNILWIKNRKEYTHSPFCSILGVEGRRGLESRQSGLAKTHIACGQVGFRPLWKALTMHFWPLHMSLCMTILSSIPFLFQPHILKCRK